MSAFRLGWTYVRWGVVLFETYYGLMQQSPFEIKEKLLKALDKEYNVVDLSTVLDVVSILEKTPISKEALEATRLGRDINELRRKTKNEPLAKRAKVLVRKWRDLIIPHNETAPVFKEASQQNGAGHNVRSAIARSHPISPAISLPNSDKSSIISPVLSSSRVEAVPKTHAANKRLRKSITSSAAVVDNKRLAVETTPELPPAKRAKTESQNTSKQRINGEHYDSVGSDCEIISITPANSKQKIFKKAPKDRTPKASVVENVVKEKIARIARIPKVKTTKELLAGLKSRSGDAASNSVYPVVDHDVVRNKTEHIAKFLRSQPVEDEPEVIDVESNENGSDTVTEAPTPKEVPPVLQTTEDILSRLPPLDLNAINWDESPIPSPVPQEVGSEEVDKVFHSRVEGLNGNYVERGNSNSVFREWHEVLTRTAANSEPLYILPYVIIN